MRNELNDIEKIERYLKNEMSAEEKVSFEKEMELNPALKKSVQEQRELLKGMERMEMKKNAAKAHFKYRFQKGMINVGIPVLVVVGITTLILSWSSSDKAKPETPNTKPETKYDLPTLNENGDSLWADADKYIPYQVYSIDAEKDTVIVGKDGMVLAIPANCFADENGNAVKGKIDFELKEALDTKTILEGGLSTMSNGELLETGGMFYINARQDGKSLKIAEGKNIYADVPSDPDKTGMMLFDGERKPDGGINWVDPKPIEKPLVPVDIKTLNFYPPLYEDSLAKMGKDVTNKKYKDSLYYSFAGRFGKDDWKAIDQKKMEEKDTIGGGAYLAVSDSIANYSGNNHIVNGEKLFKANCAFCHSPNKAYTGPYLKGARKRWKNAGYEKEIYEWVKNPRKLLFEKKNPYAVALFQKWKQSGIMTGHNLNKDEINAIFDYIDNYQSDSEGDNKSFSGLNPAKVKSIWNDKFQNTLIATKEFEERMPYIHKLCSRGNNVLDMYVKNIDKKMCTIDSMVANTLSGVDKEQFLKFAARGEGRVKMEDNCLKKLGEYYDAQTKIYTEAAKKTSEEYYLKHEEKNKESEKKSNEEALKDFTRKNENYRKELEINIKDAYRQIGGKPNIVNGAVRVSVGTSGWKNLDQYVIAATLNRETMVYTDPFSGKKAVLKYEPLEVKINEVEKYDRVLVYLIPDQLNSFMRMKKEGNVFTEKLNMLFKHELVILAYKGEKSYFKYYEHINPGLRDRISLEEMNEKEINNKLNSLKKLQPTNEMKKDISYQFYLQADAKRRKVFLEKERFIRRIEMVIFPCGNWDEIPVAVAAEEIPK